MTNPNKAIGTPAAYNGRGSVNGFGDSLGILDGRGIISGWNCQPKSGMTVQIGGQSAVRDIALAEDNANNRVTINNRSAAPIDVEIGAAPATNNRIDAIVAYVDQPANGDESTTDNPDACGIIVVSGTVAANPQAPTEAQIRTAITADGATGANAYYAILATVRVGTNVTTIGAGVITQGTRVKPTIPNSTITTAMLASEAVTPAKVSNALKSAITIKGNYGSNPASASNSISLPTTASSSGSGLTRSGNNYVVIGTGITRVAVSGAVFYEKQSQDYQWCSIAKNDTEATPASIVSVNSGFGTASIPEFVLTVTNGDKISLFNKDAGQVRGTECWLTVRAIG